VEPRPGLELVQADLFDPEAVAAVVAAAAADRDIPVRGVVNLVGGFAAGGRVHETAVEEFEAQFRLNLRPTYLVTQAALSGLISAGGGSIVCVGTRAALVPFPGAAGYISSKAAVIAFAQAVAVEYRDQGVRCNAILPSVANFSLAISLVVAGQLLVEIVFSYPGIGYLLFHAVTNQDYPMVQGIFLVITLVVLLANFLADIVYVSLDPRVRQEA